MSTAPRRDLREYLAQVPDPRGRKGRRHVFTATLTAVVCAILQSCRSCEAIGQWLHSQPIDFLQTLGFFRRPPTASGVRKLLARIDVVALEQALSRWITDLLGESAVPDELRQVILDGKALCGTWDRLGRVLQLLDIIDQQTRCVLHQQAVPPDTNEHKAALELLKNIVLKGRILTADAAFCHQDVCQAIVDSGGHYVLPVKDNQPQLLAAIQSEFAAENAVFSPLRTAGTQRRAGHAYHPRQRTRPHRAPHVNQHYGAQCLPATAPGLVERPASVPRDSRSHLDRSHHRTAPHVEGDGVWHQQPVTPAGQCRTTAATQPGPLDD